MDFYIFALIPNLDVVRGSPGPSPPHCRLEPLSMSQPKTKVKVKWI